MQGAAVIIVAAGKGLRMGTPVPKQYLDLRGRSVLARTVSSALDCPDVGGVLVAIHPDWRAHYDKALEGIADSRLLEPVAGGAERSDTVRLALEALEPLGPETVLIHDAARPFASPALHRAVIGAIRDGRGAIAAEPVVDALWREAEGDCDAPVPRAGLWRAQTPQGFPFEAILAAHRAQAGQKALDDAEVYRRAGHAVELVTGEPDNFKITTAADMARAERIAAGEGRMNIRMGHGFDVHRFEDGDHVTLCGVQIPHNRSLSGHSDADVGLHALADAIYGALAEGDIGRHFPPSDPQWKGADSSIFLAHAGRLVAERGGRISNLDVTILAERPKIGPHAAAMSARVAEILGIGADRVSIKATTMERMGFIGREEGLGCIATATVILGGAA